MKKEILFTLTKKDFIVQTYKGSGPGGQHRNKTETGVRIIHPVSGARTENCDCKSQQQNKEKAFRKLVESKEFKSWHKLEVAKRLGTLADIEQQVDDEMKPENLKIEVMENGLWLPYEK